MFRVWLTTLITVGLLAGYTDLGQAGERDFRLSAAPELVESGVLKYLLPRFSLKTQARIELVPAGAEADAVIGKDGTPIFVGLGQTWRLQTNAPDHPGVLRFTEWLGSDIGQRTIASFQIDGAHLFTLPEAEEAETVALSMDGDAIAGRSISRLHCGRCHATSDADRMNTIGSTPSFFVLRSLSDWEERFQVFYVLNPHPSFTQVHDVTPPFPENRPSPIVPVEITLDDLEAILAYVAELEPADLGAPILHQ